jgi:hypothetical protein
VKECSSFVFDLIELFGLQRNCVTASKGLARQVEMSGKRALPTEIRQETVAFRLSRVVVSP